MLGLRIVVVFGMPAPGSEFVVAVTELSVGNENDEVGFDEDLG